MSYLGVGIYSVSEASRYAGVHPARIRRYLRGYSSQRALWSHELPEVGGVLSLSFRDLTELLFVDAFRRHGVPWKELRGAAEEAAKLIETTHPFSTRRFKTDGKSILAEYAEESGARSLLELTRHQYAIGEVLNPLLSGVLEFSDEDGAQRWYPMAGHKVVLDPRFQFGRPVITEGYVPTDVLAKAVRAEEGDIARVARWYDVPRASVAAAVKYEAQLAA